MADAMEFPNDWAKFLEDYSFRDHEGVYTNGARLIPTFRVEQMMHHYLRKATEDLATDNNVGSKWIPVTERLPNKEEYTTKTEDGTAYYARLLIAYKTDITEYEIGYYDGYKWMTEMSIRLIKDVVPWMPFPNMPEPPKGE